MTYEKLEDAGSIGSPRRRGIVAFSVVITTVISMIFTVPLLILSPSKDRSNVTITNDYTGVEVVISWCPGCGSESEVRLPPGTSDRSDNHFLTPRSEIAIQVYINDPQWGTLITPKSVHKINLGLNKNVTYTISQLLGPQPGKNIRFANVTNDSDLDVWVTLQNGNVILHETRLTPGQSDMYIFNAAQPVRKISTLVCDKSHGKWGTLCYYFLSEEGNYLAYNVSQIRPVETENCFFWEGTSC